jgi:hypothetical protein
MDIQQLTTFFMWCTVINGGLLIFWTIIFMAAPNLVYRTQSVITAFDRGPQVRSYNESIYNLNFLSNN